MEPLTIIPLIYIIHVILLDFVGNRVLATSRQYQTITLGVSEHRACGIALTIHDGLRGFSLETWQIYIYIYIR